MTAEWRLLGQGAHEGQGCCWNPCRALSLSNYIVTQRFSFLPDIEPEVSLLFLSVADIF